LREKELRLSDTIQYAYDSCAVVDDQKYTEVTIELQKQVLREFGFKDDEEGVHIFHSLLSMHPNDPEITDIPYYAKYNRARQGVLQCGDVVENVRVHSLDGTQSVGIMDYYQRQNPNGKPLVLLAGSIT